MNGPRRGMCPSYRKKKMLDFRSPNAKSFFLCCNWLRHSNVRLVIVLGGQVRFPQDSGNGLSEQKGSWVRACVCSSRLLKAHPWPTWEAEEWRRNQEFALAMDDLGLTHARGKVPVVALEETPVSLQGTEAMMSPLDPGLQKGEDIESVISHVKSSQVKSHFTFFFHHLSFLLPPFPHPMAYEQFLPLLLFICFEINFSLGPTYMWTDKFLERCHTIFPLVLPQ